MPGSPDLKFNRSIADLITDTRRPHPFSETGWHNIGASGDQNIPFENGWGNADVEGAAPAGYYLSESGEVRMRGKVAGGDEGTVICTLPEEVRPEYTETFIVPVTGGGRAEIDVRPNGEVYVVYIQPPA